MTVRNGRATAGSSSTLRTVIGAASRSRAATARTRSSIARSAGSSGRSGSRIPSAPRMSVLGPCAAVPPRTREDSQVAEWRRIEIFEWLYAEGPKTIAEIKDHFELSQNTARADVDQLRVDGRLQRTGRDRQGPRGGRPSAEFEAVDSSHAQTTPGEAEQQAATPPREQPEVQADSGAGDAAAADRASEEGQPTEVGAAAVGREVAAPEPQRRELTLHEQLVHRYVSALIGWIDRSTVVRDQGPPEHVYDRIERLLQIEDGVA